MVLCKAHLTSHSRTSQMGVFLCCWVKKQVQVITPLSLFGSWRSFLYSSSVYSCHLVLKSSPSVTISVLYCAYLEKYISWVEKIDPKAMYCHFTEEEIQKFNKHMKRSSTFLIKQKVPVKMIQLFYTHPNDKTWQARQYHVWVIIWRDRNSYTPLIRIAPHYLTI